MQKKIMVSIFYIYEICRLFFILLFRPEFSTDVLPVSWYAAVPLLGLPLILIYLYHVPAFQIYRPCTGRLFCLATALSDGGMLVSITAILPVSLVYGQMNGFYSIFRFNFMMIFLISDVILCIRLLLKLHKKESAAPVPGQDTAANGDNELCR